MSILKKIINKNKQSKIKTVYDPNLPIEQYSEKQIVARTETELGKKAAKVYLSLQIQLDPFKYDPMYDYIYTKGISKHNLPLKYFLNEFFVKAVALKARNMLIVYYDNLDKEAYVTLQKVQRKVKEIDDLVAGRQKRIKEAIFSANESEQKKCRRA